MKCSVWAGLVVSTLLFGCSDDTEPLPDAGPVADAAVVDSDARVDVSVDTTGPDGYVDLFDVIPLPDAGCPACIRDRCGSQINSCFNNPACTLGVFCTLQMCATGLFGADGGFSPSSMACVLGCFNGDQNTAFMAFGSLTCLTMTCGPVCDFLDAGSDAGPPRFDVRPQPDADATVDAVEDASDDGTAPDTGTDADAVGTADGDGATPGDDAEGDATADTVGQPDTAPPLDASPESAP